jgi:hypothetical protein
VKSHLEPVMPPNGIWMQHNRLYHSTIFHASTHMVRAPDVQPWFMQCHPAVQQRPRVPGRCPLPRWERCEMAQKLSCSHGWPGCSWRVH